MPPIVDHPLRHGLAAEMHARPFPTITTPGNAVFLALKNGPDADDHRRALEHFTDLLDHYGAPRPDAGATHYFGEIGQYWIKWEQHTKFSSYLIFRSGQGARAFDPAAFKVFPQHWQERQPGARITSGLVRIMPRPDRDAEIAANLDDWFVAESVAAANVLDQSAVIVSDFRIDPAGHLRICVFVSEETGKGRVGRIVQRICELEIYKAMSLLGLSKTREIAEGLGQLDTQFGGLTDAMRAPGIRAEDTLQSLLDISVGLERLRAQTAYRFAATRAYSALVTERIAVLRETRFQGRQSFAEFMMRRYEPAMRTVGATERRLQAMSDRVVRASELLRTQVDVERSAQNQDILASMDRRADLQLRLQKTVEGLSVVAISYYAVSLAGYLVYPFAGWLGLSKGTLTALITLPVIAVIWFAMHRIKRHVE